MSQYVTVARGLTGDSEIMYPVTAVSSVATNVILLTVRELLVAGILNTETTGAVVCTGIVITTVALALTVVTFPAASFAQA